MPTQASKLDPAAARPPEHGASASAKRQKLPALLVTSDDSLWTQIGAIGDQWAPRQIDSVDDLIATTQAGHSAVILWDARGQTPAAAVLSRIQMHSDRFVIVALDAADNAAAWEAPLQHRQIVAHASTFREYRISPLRARHRQSDQRYRPVLRIKDIYLPGQRV